MKPAAGDSDFCADHEDQASPEWPLLQRETCNLQSTSEHSSTAAANNPPVDQRTCLQRFTPEESRNHLTRSGASSIARQCIGEEADLESGGQGRRCMKPAAGDSDFCADHEDQASPEWPLLQRETCNLQSTSEHSSTAAANNPPVDQRTCLQRFKTQAESFFAVLTTCRLAMFCHAVLAVSPVVDILSDHRTAATFAYNGHFWWSALTLVIIYMSGRFTILFLALCPTPSARNIFLLFVPGGWRMLRDDNTPADEASVVSPAELQDPAIRERGGAAVARAPRSGSTQAHPSPNAQPVQADPELVRITRNGFVARVHNILEWCRVNSDGCGCYSWCALLGAEIALFPFACAAIYPIGISACSLSGSYLRVALGRADDPERDDSSSGSDPASAGDRRNREMFLKTGSIVEALVESVPQLCLQVRAGFYGEELNDWVFILTFSVSAFCILKAIVTFALNYEEIWATFLDLQDERVVRFLTLGAHQPPPRGRWSVATPKQVRANPDLLREPGTGLVEWHIAYLTDGMQVHGPRRDYRVDRNTDPLGHRLFALK